LTNAVKLRWLQTSPVSWLGGYGLAGRADRKKIRCAFQHRLAAFPKRYASVARERNIRLTVARRRRSFTVFPSTKSALMVEGQGPLWVSNCGDMSAAG